MKVPNKGGWRDVTLGELFEISSSKRVLQEQWQKSGVPFYRAREIVKLAKDGVVENELFVSDALFNEYRHKYGVPSPGDLMVSAVGTLGACYVVQPGDRFYYKDASVLRLSPKQAIHSKFIQHAFSTNQILDQVNGGSGSTVGTFTIERATRTRLALPPLEEQRRIAEILDNADALRAKRRAALVQLDTLIQSIFLDMFGDPLRNRRGLPTTELENLCTRITDGTHQPPEWSTQGHPFLFVSNLITGEITFDTQKYISDETHAELTRRCPIEVGDVLYSTVGSYGVPVLVRSGRKFAFQRHIAHLKPRRNIVEPEFFKAMLASEPLKRQADRAARGVAQKTVNLADIRQFRVFIPTIEMQRDFVNKYRMLDEMKRLEIYALKELDALFASLQHRAFRGEL